MTIRTGTATIVLASLLGLAVATPASAQRASCGQLAGLIESERALERQARDEQREFIQGYAAISGSIIDGGGHPVPLSGPYARELRSINGRVRRHSGNVARLQGRYARQGCGDTQQAARSGVDPGTAAAIGALGIGIGILGSGMLGHSSGYRRSSRGGSGGYGSGGSSGGSSYGSGSSRRRY